MAKLHRREVKKKKTPGHQKPDWYLNQFPIIWLICHHSLARRLLYTMTLYYFWGKRKSNYKNNSNPTDWNEEAKRELQETKMML